MVLADHIATIQEKQPYPRVFARRTTLPPELERPKPPDASEITRVAVGVAVTDVEEEK
ncbi:hypothetical protein [Agreia sp. COWG]|uniref:hypothetical protein n=1 Tax=Agreia sp. COWG TaxID=2773266 RepID=UPI0019267AD4|nr:hypothetical protein [Agreia sp. COWG]CAD5990438.1 protein of unknown function [Agreia sp. COWG]